MGALTLEPTDSLVSPSWLQRAANLPQRRLELAEREAELLDGERRASATILPENAVAGTFSPQARPVVFQAAKAIDDAPVATPFTNVAPTDYFVGYGTEANVVAVSGSLRSTSGGSLATSALDGAGHSIMTVFSVSSHPAAPMANSLQSASRGLPVSGVSEFRADGAAPVIHTLAPAYASSPVSSGGFTDLAATAPGQARPAPLLARYGPDALPTGATLYVSELNGLIGKAPASGGSVSNYQTINSSHVLLGIAYTGDSLYVVDQTAASIVRVVLSTNTVSTFATLPGTSAPTALVADASSNLFVSLTASNRIARITPAGAISDFASLAAGSAPEGLAIGPGGNLFVATTNGGSNSTSNPPSILRITPQGVAPPLASINGSVLGGLAVDASGNVYAADENSGAVYRVTSAGVVSTFANLGSNAFPLGLTFDANGVVYAAVTGGISQISASGVVSTFATDSNNPAYLVVVPEPTTYLGGALLACVAMYGLRRRTRIA